MSSDPVTSNSALIARSWVRGTPQATKKKQFLVPIAEIVADMGAGNRVSRLEGAVR